MCFLTLPVVVDGPGKYITRSGEVVRIDRVSGNRAYGNYPNGIAEWWSVRGGRVLPYSLSQNDIVAKDAPASL